MSEDNRGYTKLGDLNCDISRLTGLTCNRKTITMVSYFNTLRVVDKLTGKCLDKQFSSGELTSLFDLTDRHLFAITDTTGFIHLYANIGAPLEHIMTYKVY